MGSLRKFEAIDSNITSAVMAMAIDQFREKTKLFNLV